MDGKEGLSHLGARIRELLDGDPRAAGETRRARDGFLAEVERRNGMPRARAPRQRPRGAWVALSASAVVVAVGIGVVPRLRFEKGPVTFRVDDAGPGRLGDVVEAADGRTVPIAFSDGSRLALHDQGRMRVVSLDARADAVSVQVLLEDGALDASIAHPRGVKTRWQFDAGPYHVTVTGTRFRMQLRDGQRSLRLSTEEGRVVVSGGCLPEPRAVSAGESLDSRCPAVPAVTGEARAVEAPRADGAPPASAPPQPVVRARAGRSDGWRELLAAGRLQEGLHAAERANFQRVCETASADELLALADAGRFFGPYTRAVAALGALRRRFPGTPEAGTAAFTLGRIAFDNQNAYGRAASWFETYLREQPTGPLMGDAFGRLIEARLRSGDRIGARATAEQYLRRFPAGPYASEARGILSK
ncbi:MAG TPA: tetratricopeptide repeat protein [Polyangia bacterium]|nr:tetratricopeptide repeat protein [Polyangia bacterium]